MTVTKQNPSCQVENIVTHKISYIYDFPHESVYNA